MNNKKNYRKPYLLKGFLLGLLIFSALCILFTLQLGGIAFFLSLLLSLFFSVCCTHQYIKYIANKQNTIYLEQFKTIEELGAYEEAWQQDYVDNKKYDHFVLLLHGFTASPHELEQLILDLKKKKIPYFAPMIMGFGLTKANLLENITSKDLLRSALLHYDFLTTISHKVSIVGHSMGGVLATYIAQNRKAHRLVLTSPALYFFPEDKMMIKLLTTPILSTVFMLLFPYLPKTVKHASKDTNDPGGIANTRFQYLSVPSKAIKSMLIAKQHIDLTKINDTKLSVIYGDIDRVVNIPECLRVLKKNQIPHDAFSLKDTAHNIFEETQKYEASKTVIHCLHG